MEGWEADLRHNKFLSATDNDDAGSIKERACGSSTRDSFVQGDFQCAL